MLGGSKYVVYISKCYGSVEVLISKILCPKRLQSTRVSDDNRNTTRLNLNKRRHMKKNNSIITSLTKLETSCTHRGCRLLTGTEVAELLGLKNKHTLDVWRTCKRYPELAYCRVGRLIRYPECAITNFLNKRMVGSTQ
jgi:hypothetical protein